MDIAAAIWPLCACLLPLLLPHRCNKVFVYLLMPSMLTTNMLNNNPSDAKWAILLKTSKLTFCIPRTNTACTKENKCNARQHGDKSWNQLKRLLLSSTVFNERRRHGVWPIGMLGPVVLYFVGALKGVICLKLKCGMTRQGIEPTTYSSEVGHSTTSALSWYEMWITLWFTRNQNTLTSFIYLFIFLERKRDGIMI